MAVAVAVAVAVAAAAAMAVAVLSYTTNIHIFRRELNGAVECHHYQRLCAVLAGDMPVCSTVR